MIGRRVFETSPRGFRNQPKPVLLAINNPTIQDAVSKRAWGLRPRPDVRQGWKPEWQRPVKHRPMLKLWPNSAGEGQGSALCSLVGPLQIERRSAQFSGVHACAMYSSLVAPLGSTFLSEKLP